MKAVVQRDQKAHGAWRVLAILWMWCVAAQGLQPAVLSAAEEMQIAGDGQPLVLEDEAGLVAIQSNRIVSLFDKDRSLEHAAPQSAISPGLFRVTLVDGIEPVLEIDAAVMASRVRRQTEEELEISFESDSAEARVSIELGDRPGETLWRIEVEPKNPDLAISSVAFPLFETPRYHNGLLKRQIEPRGEGFFGGLGQGELYRSYPSSLFAQMTACSSYDGGFMLWTDDTKGHVKAFGHGAGNESVEFAVNHMMPYEPGDRWESPYHTRLTFCGGQWQDAADIYRGWALEQPWSRTALRDREMPEIVTAPPICISTDLDQEDLETLPERLAAWGERFNAPVVYRPLGWEKYGDWVGIDYFPPAIGEEAMLDLNQRLQERNVAFCAFISGYHWNVYKMQLTISQQEELLDFFNENNGWDVCEVTPQGYLASYVSEGRAVHNICRGTEFGNSFLRRMASELFDLGIPIVHDDQDPGPSPNGIFSCFSYEHGHPVPCGPWSTEVMHEEYQGIRREAERRDMQDFFLTKEYPMELFNMDLHAYQGRSFQEDVRPGLIPLALYLYHEDIPAIHGYAAAETEDLYKLSAMLVYGQIPGIAFWNTTCGGFDDVPARSITLLEDYYSAVQSFAKDFLLYGRMQRPLFDSPVENRLLRRYQTRFFNPPVELALPQVVQGVFEDGEGRIGVFAINRMDEDVTVSVPAPGPGAWRAALFTGADQGNVQAVAPGDALPWNLAPGRMCSIVFEPAE